MMNQNSKPEPNKQSHQPPHPEHHKTIFFSMSPPSGSAHSEKRVVRVSAPQNEEEHKKALPRRRATYTYKKGQGVRSKITAIPTIHLPWPAGVLDLPRDRPCNKCKDA